MLFKAAISGMKAAQTNLETIGHNVANANTAGFKQARAEFADIYAVSQAGIANTTPGSGVTVSQISQQFGQGNISTTDSVLDMAIDGDGFFVLEDAGSRVYSRAGAFSLDKDGFIVNAAKQKLITYQVDPNGDITGVEGPIQLSVNVSNPVATSTLSLQLNLNSDAIAAATPTPAIDITDPTTFDNTSSLTIFDSLGHSHLATVYYQKTAANTWNSQISIDGDATLLPAAPHNIIFDTRGALDVVASNTPPVTFNPPGADPVTLGFDYEGTTQFGSKFSPISLSQNGHPQGDFSGITIDSEGFVSANFTFGEPEIQGQVIFSKFKNPNGLVNIGNNAWVETSRSGIAATSVPGSTGVGLLRSGALEDSNVDLTKQLVEMIIAQRNFQANAQVITTADSITQTVINIR